MRNFGPGPLGRSRLGPYSEPTVISLTRSGRPVSSSRWNLMRDGRDRRSSRRDLDAADRITKRGRLSEFASVTIDAGVTARIDRVPTDQRRFFSICYAKPTPLHTGGHNTHARPLDPSSGGRSR